MTECLIQPQYLNDSTNCSQVKKGRGQVPNRPGPSKYNRESRLCPILVDVSSEELHFPKCVYPNCSFIHDVDKYLEEKGKDIGTECPVFASLGHCKRGLTCRFASQHILRKGAQDVRNCRNTNKKICGSETNQLAPKLQNEIRKKTFDFTECDRIVNWHFTNREAAPESTKIKNEHEHENKKRKKKRTIDWKNKLYLAPLTTLGNLPFRRICKGLGADITCGEMAMGLSLLSGKNPEWALLHRHSSEDIFGVQVCGGSPLQMSRAAHLLENYTTIDFVDINLGCPIDSIFKKGCGSGLMMRKKPLEVMIRSMSEILSVPLTVKIRTGIYSDKRIAHTLIPSLKEWGIDLITLHGRSREQRYTKSADWLYIQECSQVADSLPFFGNGDIMDYETYNSVKGNVDGVMIGRGALIKPWIFREIKEQRHWDISATERLDYIRDFVTYGLEHWGSDDKGIENTRRFLLEWLSFLHRYVPLGILVKPPQYINDQVKRFSGRSDLETLLSSPQCSDWIKITEMFLGPVSDSFIFQPKHRAHAY